VLVVPLGQPVVARGRHDGMMPSPDPGSRWAPRAAGTVGRRGSAGKLRHLAIPS
jgi:hypothetical protein